MNSFQTANSPRSFNKTNRSQMSYIPTSYGNKYNDYHKNEYNKPFTQQKGEYLYDMY